MKHHMGMDGGHVCRRSKSRDGYPSRVASPEKRLIAVITVQRDFKRVEIVFANDHALAKVMPRCAWQPLNTVDG